MANPNWKPGQSGNPKGRPPKSRALTEILEKSLSKTHNGKSRKRILAEAVSELVTTGSVTLSGRTLRVSSVREWVESVKWIYSQIDGPPRLDVDVDTTGIVKVEVSYVNRWGDGSGDESSS